MDFFVWLSLLLGIPSATWGLFLALQASLPQSKNCKVTAWLEKDNLRIVADQWSERWPETFTAIFDHIFGHRKVSLRFFSVSALFSVILFFVCLAIWYLSTPWNIAIEFSDRPLTGIILLLGLFVFSNIIPDYLSNCQTRAIISKLSERSINLKHYFFWLVLDFSLTALIAISIVGGLSYLVHVYLAVSPGTTWIDAMYRVRFNISHIFSLSFLNALVDWKTGITYTEPPYGTLFYTTFMTSAWLWLYSLSGTIISTNQKTFHFLAKLIGWFDVKKSPLGAIGGVCAIILAAVYLIASPWIAPFLQSAT